MHILPIRQDSSLFIFALPYSTDEAVTSYAEFNVHKHCQRHLDPVRRILCLTETCLVERDPATYHIVTLKPLSEVSLTLHLLYLHAKVNMQL